MPNQLAKETSPYLLQHADNPVDWYAWGEEALERARKEDKPILLSIGYSACHWCHVMAHQSFENEAIAALMNEKFINIKVDREERPDIDTVYMEAVQTLTGHGGWPLTVFLTPEGKPFYGGTYFPPEDRDGMPGLPRVLEAAAEAYHQRRQDIEATARKLKETMSKPIIADTQPLVADLLVKAYLSLKKDYDSSNGGFGTAPKFPQPLALDYLLRYYHRHRDETALEVVTHSLEKMARGGIYDQIGGGFHRYATDGHWQVPHFEKMLYDNAQLSQVYLHAYLVTGDGLFRSIATETLDYVLREMTDAKGGFYSAQDADTEGTEGTYYLWTPKEITEAVGEVNSKEVIEYYGVTEKGNFDERNILHVAADKAKAELIEKARAVLLEKRQQRVRPGRDEKVLASWNGLMLASLAEAACALNRPDYLAAATANGRFLLDTMISDGRLNHSYKDGEARIDGYLDDYAMVIEGLLSLHLVTFAGRWLTQAIKLAGVMVDEFWDKKEETFYDTGRGQEELFVRPRSTYDGVFPSAGSAASMALLKLSRLTGNQEWRRLAVQSLRSVRELMQRYPLGFANWLSALDFYLSRPMEIAIIGPRDDPAAGELLKTICSTWLPGKVTAACDPGDTAPAELSLFEGRAMVDGKPAVY
ncbi:MAG: thioredoxin domain-containing protein, partial [Dehalococcoidales bacterium]